MGRPLIDLTGQTFGMWKVIKYAGKNKHRRRMWKVLCSCGAVRIVIGRNLISGGSTNCGCLRSDKIAKGLKRIHGQCKTPAYRSWCAMRARCINPNDDNWRFYGGATPPVRVCKRWQGKNGFIHFLADMGERPAGTSLSRFGDIGNYKPSNCAWHTRAQQTAEHKKKRLRLERTQ